MEGSERHIDMVDGGEVGEFFESDRFGVLIGGTDLTADLSKGAGDENGFERWIRSEGTD